MPTATSRTRNAPLPPKLPPNLRTETRQPPPQSGELPPQEPSPDEQAPKTVFADLHDKGVSNEVKLEAEHAREEELQRRRANTEEAEAMHLAAKELCHEGW
ncbi:MAG: hypothetical protein M1816_004149 [Peltula sp. TS41687]|nr:MAG: hypothetical protein M1816_004149 [Peltula sp. TS41687]